MTVRIFILFVAGIFSPFVNAGELPKLGDKWVEPALGLSFIYIEPGRFLMGSAKGEANRYADERQHEVRIKKGFWMGQYEITFAQYDEFAKEARRAKPNDQGWGRGDRPVMNVKWFDAVLFSQWLSDKTGHRYRLPTEAEWEYAARAGTTTAFSFGDKVEDFTAYAWNGDSADNQTHPVGQKKPNPWGLYDIHGNVWEWTGSAYSKDYDGHELKQSPYVAVDKRHVVARGGAWYFFPKGMRSADRRLYFPGFRLAYIGFRLVREE